MSSSSPYAVPFEPGWGRREVRRSDEPGSPATLPPPPPRDGAVVDFAAVAAVQRAVAEQLAGVHARAGGAGVSEEQARAVIVRRVTAYADERASGGAVMSVAAEQALARAVFASIFGLGPALQPLLEDPTVENVDAHGFDNVWVEYADGRLEPGPPLASSDGELVELVGRVARDLAQTTREFSTARPLLNVRLPVAGSLVGARLAATMAVSDVPHVSFRRHRLVDVTLDDLLASGTISLALWGLFRAAVRARRTIVVTGPMSSGKTTLLRALAAEFARFEQIATIETEIELGLHLLPARHRRVFYAEVREATADAPDSGVDVFDLIKQVLRHNCRRVILGEVRGPEIVAMLDVVANGHPGSLATVHALRGHAAIDRMVELSTRGGLSETSAMRLIAGSVNLIVHMELVEDLTETAGGGVLGRRQRFVDEVLEVAGLSDAGRPALNTLFRPGPDGRAVPSGTEPADLDILIRAGLDVSLLRSPDGLWDPSGGLR